MGRSAEHETVGDVPHLDVREMVRQGGFRAGQRLAGKLAWNWPPWQRSEVEIVAEEKGLWLSHNGRSYHVPIERLRCPFGGARAWFRCPVCGRRCAILYLRAGYFACRRCQALVYHYCVSSSRDASSLAFSSS